MSDQSIEIDCNCNDYMVVTCKDNYSTTGKCGRCGLEYRLVPNHEDDGEWILQ